MADLMRFDLGGASRKANRLQDIELDEKVDQKVKKAVQEALNDTEIQDQVPA